MTYTLMLYICPLYVSLGILPRTPAGRMTPAPLPGESREGDGLPVKYCQTCNFYRPPRAKHCKFCDNCVLEFDHHCPWTGSCVGRRNYSHFLTFLGTTFAYTVFMAVVSFRVILRPITILQSIPYPFTPTLLDSVKQTLSQRPMAAVLFCYAVVLLCSVVPLIIYHLELLANGITTNEEVRRRYNGPSPYNRGFCGMSSYLIKTSTFLTLFCYVVDHFLSFIYLILTSAS